jgi:hypothetical protein
MYENCVEGITDADYQRAQPYVEAHRWKNRETMDRHSKAK